MADTINSLCCPYCERYWPPDADDYALCPCCLEPTRRSNTAALDKEDALCMRREFEFGWWLWENERV